MKMNISVDQQGNVRIMTNVPPQIKCYKWINNCYVLQSNTLLLPTTKYDPLRSEKGAFE